MLINNSIPKNNDIVTVRLVTGDEIVGKLVIDFSEVEPALVIDKPICVLMQQAGNGQVSLRFAPFFGSVDDPVVRFRKTATICDPVLSRKDVADAYKQMHSTIIQPDSKLKL